MTKEEDVDTIAESLLAAASRRDSDAAMKAIRSPLLAELNRQHQGLGNLNLAFAFAQILVRECPAEARDQWGVPRLDLLVGDTGEQLWNLPVRQAVGEAVGKPVSTADVKAEMARFAEAIPLAQQFIQIWVREPQRVVEFVSRESGTSAAMVDEVWGVLAHACSALRSVNQRRA